MYSENVSVNSLLIVVKIFSADKLWRLRHSGIPRGGAGERCWHLCGGGCSERCRKLWPSRQFQGNFTVETAV